MLGLHQALGDRQNYVAHAGVHEVFEENLLAALGFMNSRIVGQIVGNRLITVSQIGGAERRVHHLHRRSQTAFRWPVLRRQWESFLNIGHIFLK